jgi:hypothetical protein
MNVDVYTAIIDTAILVLLLGWSWLDRHNIYFGKKKE